MKRMFSALFIVLLVCASSQAQISYDYVDALFIDHKGQNNDDVVGRVQYSVTGTYLLDVLLTNYDGTQYIGEMSTLQISGTGDHVFTFNNLTGQEHSSSGYQVTVWVHKQGGGEDSSYYLVAHPGTAISDIDGVFVQHYSEPPPPQQGQNIDEMYVWWGASAGAVNVKVELYHYEDVFGGTWKKIAETVIPANQTGLNTVDFFWAHDDVHTFQVRLYTSNGQGGWNYVPSQTKNVDINHP